MSDLPPHSPLQVPNSNPDFVDRGWDSLSRFFDIRDAMLAVMDERGRFRRVNGAWEATLGFEEGELLEMAVADLIHPEDRTTADDGSDFMASCANPNGIRFRRKDGGYRWLRWSSTVDRQAGLAYGVASDITEWVTRANAEALVRERPRRMALDQPDRARAIACGVCDFTRFFQLSHELLVIIDGSGHVVTANPAWRSLLGYAEDEVRGLHIADLICPDDRERVLREWSGVLDGRPVCDVPAKLLTADGECRPTVWSAFRDPHREIVFSIGADRQEITRARRDEAQVRSIMESVLDPILSVDASGVVMEMNRAVSDVFGLAESELIGEDVRRIIPGFESLAHGAEDTQRQRGLYAAESETVTHGLRGEQEESFPLRVSVAAADSPAGRFFTILARDLTQEYLDQARYLDEVRTLEAYTIHVHLANELHDGLLQSLTGASLQLEIIQKLLPWDPASARERLKDLQTSLIDEQRELRFFVDEFKSGADGWSDHDAPVESRLRRMLDRVAGIWDIKCSLSANIVDEPSVQRAHEVLRIVHEAAVNAARHGGSTRIEVSLECGPEGTVLRIGDNGSGFGVEGRWTHDELIARRLGPVRLNQRVMDNGGTCEVRSSDQGAMVMVVLPPEASGP